MRHVIGQHLMIGLSGHTLTDEEKNFIVKNNISGVTLFSRNVAEPKQVRDLCAQLQSLRHQMPDKAPLYIGIDMEGGRVARLKAPFTQWPPLQKLGILDSPTASFHLAYYMGMELKSVGINLDYAPCVDVFTNPKNTVIGDRSLGSDPQLVEKHASALVRGYLKSEVIPCIKHFPGHGNTLLDSHEALPIEESDLKALEACSLIPFKKAIRSRTQMMMTSHILFKNIDPEWPVTLSEIFLRKLAREELRYRGLIVSDDLDMKALKNNYDKKKIAVRALQAGVDLLLYCNEPDSPPTAIEAIEEALAQGSVSADELTAGHKKILEMKKEFISHPDPRDFTEATKIIGSAEHFKLSQAIASGNLPPGLLGPT